MKLIALDLDETLLDRRGDLSPANRMALQWAAAQGIEIVVATGRAYSALPQWLPELPEIRYAITGNGVAVYDLRQGTVLRRFLLPKEAAEQVFAASAGESLTYEATVQGQPYAQADYIRYPERYLDGGVTGDYLRRTRRPVADIQTFIRQHAAELDSLNLVVSDLKTKERVTERLRKIPDIYITTSVPRLVEISHRNCGKHRGLQFLADRLEIAQTETAAFGNADNDAEMLHWAGVGVAVGNASPSCKAAADRITVPHWEDAVAKVFAEDFQIP